MLGLVYSTNTADSTAILQPGNVTVADFSELETARVLSSKSQALGALRYTANRYVMSTCKQYIQKMLIVFKLWNHRTWLDMGRYGYYSYTWNFVGQQRPFDILWHKVLQIRLPRMDIQTKEI